VEILEIEVFKVYVLVLIRFSGLAVSAPVLGSRTFPALAKIGLAAMTALIVTPSVAALPQTLASEPLPFALAGVRELLIGLILGFVMTIVFAAIQVAGEIMDMMSGFALMNVINPALETQAPIFGFFLYILAILLLLAINGHHLMIRGLVSTFERIPLGGLVVRERMLVEVARLGSGMFADGLMIAAPVAGAILLAYVVLGLLGRVVPQIHLLAVGFSFTIATGLLVTALVMGLYLHILDQMFGQMFRQVSSLIRTMS
jgi:flagellar biosynthesis protein FliR